MKLSVRNKIANGLVIFLVVPRMAHTAVDLFDSYRDGINTFTAEDEFDLNSDTPNFGQITLNADPAGDPSGGDPTGGDPTGGDPTGGDPTGGDPTGGDPTGGDPTGGDPTGGDPTGGDPTGGDPSGGDPSGGDPTGCDPSGLDSNGRDLSALNINAPRQLVTAEDGSSDMFEVSMLPDPATTRYFQFVSNKPDEAVPVPGAVAFSNKSCIPKSIWVVGQNDALVDGDIKYEIEIRDENNIAVATVPGVNLDNDNYRGFAVRVAGPNALPPGEKGMFLVRVANISREELKKNSLYIETTPGLTIKEFAASLLSGDKFKGKGKIMKDVLTFDKVDIEPGDVLLVSVEAVLGDGGQVNEKLSARIVSKSGDEETDDDLRIRTSLP